MNSKGNIVFLGMMGSGKSSIGKIISKRLRVDFFDIDTLVEKELKMKISKIFQEKGEKFFREYEEKKTMEILKKKKIIISLGGGAFLNNNIRNEILNNHQSFWLSWDNETIIERIKNSSNRPLLNNLTKNDIIKLIKKRSTIYSKALYKIDCSNLTKTKIVEKILNIYETNEIKD